jgi:hypothetical protein
MIIATPIAAFFFVIFIDCFSPVSIMIVMRSMAY